MDAVCKINKAEQHLDKLPPEYREWYEHVIAEARLFQVVRELVAGLIDITEGDDG